MFLVYKILYKQEMNGIIINRVMTKYQNAAKVPFTSLDCITAFLQLSHLGTIRGGSRIGMTSILV